LLAHPRRSPISVSAQSWFMWWSKSLQINQNANLMERIFFRCLLNNALVYLLFFHPSAMRSWRINHWWKRWRAGETRENCVKRIAKNPGFSTSARTSRA
jgi:hypothetical protein